MLENKHVTYCWNCGEYFEDDPADLRPFIYHECEPRVFAATRNPALRRKTRGYIKPSDAQIQQKEKTIWYDFK